MSLHRTTAGMDAPSRILVASDRDLGRKSLVALFAQRGFRTVGQASTLAGLVAQCLRKPHELVVLDTRLPGAERGLAIRGLLARCPGEVIVAICRENGQLCTREAGDRAGDAARRTPCCPWPDCLGRALLDGARAAFPRSTSADAVVSAMRRLSRGGSRTIAVPSGALGCMSGWKGGAANGGLSQREREVARCIGRGCTNKEIAAFLGVSQATVKKHLGHVLSKLAVPDRLRLGLFLVGHPHLMAEPD